MPYTHFWVDFATLMTTICPYSAVPWYLGLTDGLEPPERLRVLRKATLVAFAILFGFLVLGEIVLKLLGVTLDGFRVGGGLVLLIVGLRLVFSPIQDPNSRNTGFKSSGDIAVFPMAMPYIAGPAAITAIVLLTENDLHNFVQQAETAVTMVVVLLLTYWILRVADRTHELLGRTGIDVMSRISGLILTAMAMQVIINGLLALFPALSVKLPTPAP
jgi:multiple antibiotic resistance protein